MPSKTQSILIGGLLVGILSTSYLGLINFFCCAGIIVGALVAVQHYGKTYGIAVETRDALTIGIGAALVGLVIATTLNFVLALVGIRADLVIQQFMLDSFGDSMPPEQAREIEDQMARPVTVGMFFGVQFLWGLLIAVIFGAVGGAIGGALTRRNAPATPPAPPLA